MLKQVLMGSTYDDVEVHEGRLCDKLQAEQNAYFVTLKIPAAVT